MADTANLKVFRTTTGVHDAYVAAPSRKAALEAWGSETNLFALGSAEQISDPRLMKAPLATPGVVVKKRRPAEAAPVEATPAEPAPVEAAAPPAERPRRERPKLEIVAASPAPATPPAAKAKTKPRPSREDFDAAQTALKQVQAAQAAALKALAAREAELGRERRILERSQARDLALATRARDTAKAGYEKAIARWRAV
jgi:hypothetical protein